MLTCMEADRARLLDLEARIIDHERALSALRTEQAQVQERLDAYKYPVLTLPNCITSEIFIHFLPLYPVPPPLTGRASPTALTYICRKWKEVALATPRLWRAIELGHSRIPYAKSRHIFDTWMKRAKSCPRSINIDVAAPEVADTVFSGPLALTIEHLKVRDVSIFSLPSPGAQMPLLRSLDFSAISRSSSDVFSFLDVPQLRTVVLHSSVISKTTLPWTQLTSLMLNVVGVNECFQILAQTPNLVECALNFSHRSPFEDFATVNLALPCLESLTLEIQVEAMTLTKKIFRSFVVPSLRKLQLKEGFLGFEDPIFQLESFISKSGCTLQEVCIAENITDQESYYRAFPSITFSFPDASEGETEDDESESQADDDQSESMDETDSGSEGGSDFDSED